jgi:hypothetical protein
MNYISVHNKSYDSVEEFNARLENYMRIDAYINEVNAPGSAHTHKAGHNYFSDWTQAEFEALMTETPLEAAEAVEGESRAV